MALSLHPSNLSIHTLLLLKPRNHFPETPTIRAFKLRSSCCCSCSRSSATKYRRKPKPGFFEQIRHKWSLKPTSARDKFPWQQEQEQHHQKQPQEGEEEEEIENPQASGVVMSEPGIDGSPSNQVSFTLPNRLTTAPWIHGRRYEETHFDSEGNVHGVCENVSHVVDNAENIGKEANCNEKLEEEEEKEVEFGLSSAAFARIKEAEYVNDLDDDGFPNGRVSGGSGEFVKVAVSNDGSVELPWKREGRVGSLEGDRREKRSNADLAEKTLPEHELKRLRNVALRMLERIKVGAAGITQELVIAIHEKWRLDEVVKLKFEEPLSRNMKRTHEILESRTGGLVIWRSGSSVVLYRGMTYKFQCVQSYAKQNEVDVGASPLSKSITIESTLNVGVKDDLVRTMGLFVPSSVKYLKELSQEELLDFNELNFLLDDLGPRFKDWCGPEPLPIDADLLPSVVPGYKPPFRLLPYGIKHCLKNKEMTIFRRLARTMPPHFALGRSRDLQGLAKAMVKLWERSAIAKIAIKRGVLNTRNERMAEELKRLTGGTLLSRNKEYIVFYRGNDFLPPAVTETLKERRKQTYLHQDEEDEARQMALAVIQSNIGTTKGPMVAGTLTETIAATSHWENQRSSTDVEEMMRESDLARRVSLVKHLKNKLAIAKGKLKKSEKALGKVQEHLEPTDPPTDLETLTNEERFLFRKIGLSMKPYLLLGRREVYDGTIENMHLHWKYRELVKVIVKRKSLAQVKHIAISLEAESGGVLVSVDKTTNGHSIILYRGKNYLHPSELKPANLLTRRQALARSIELQRREALKHHISDLQERIELVTSEVDEMEAGKCIDGERTPDAMLDDASVSDEDTEE